MQASQFPMTTADSPEGNRQRMSTGPCGALPHRAQSRWTNPAFNGTVCFDPGKAERCRTTSFFCLYGCLVG